MAKVIGGASQHDTGFTQLGASVQRSTTCIAGNITKSAHTESSSPSTARLARYGPKHCATPSANHVPGPSRSTLRKHIRCFAGRYGGACGYLLGLQLTVNPAYGERHSILTSKTT